MPANVSRTNLIFVSIACFLTYAIIAGIVSQSGTLSAAMASHFAKPLTEATSLFSYFSTGNMLGYAVSLIIYEHLSLKRTFIFCYVTLFISLFSISFWDSWSSFPLLLLISGLTAGLGLNTAAVTISLFFESRMRASMLLGADICFTGAGVVVSPITVALVQNGFPWSSFLWILCTMSGLLVLIACFARFPKTAKETGAKQDGKMFTRVSVLCGLGLFAYMFAQTSMLLWLPNYIQGGMEAGSIAISHYWIGMVTGQVAVIFILIKFPLRRVFLFSCISSVIISVFLLVMTKPVFLQSLTLLLGLANAGLFKLAISYSAEQVSHPQRLVTFLLFAAAAGIAASPMLSSALVAQFGIYFGIQLVPAFTVIAAAFFLYAMYSFKSITFLETQKHVT